MSRFARLTLVALLAAGALSLAGPARAAPTANGRIVYSSTTAPQDRTYTAGTPGTFAGAVAMPTGAAQTFMVDRAAPTRDEHIVGYVTAAGVLYIYRWDGASWTNETSALGQWGGTVTVGGDGLNGRRFDIAYEEVSGNAMVVYSNNTSGTNELRYRTWDGNAWSPATAFDSARMTTVPTWIKLLPRPGSNEIALMAADNGTSGTGNSSRLTAMVWSGSGWGNEPSAALATNYPCTTAQLVQNDAFDMAWETQSGILWVFWTQSTPQQYRRSLSAARPTGTWGTATSFATGHALPLQMVAASDPQSNDVMVGWNRSTTIGTYASINASGTWSSPTTARDGATTPQTPAIQKKTVAARWVVAGGTSYLVFMWGNNTAASLGYTSASVSGTTVTWSTATSVTFSGGTFGTWAWMDSIVDPRSLDTLMLTFSDANSDLRARQLVVSAGPTLTWTTDTSAALSTTLTNATTQNFSFAYDRVPPSTTVGDGTEPGNTAQLCPGNPALLDGFTLRTNGGTDALTSVTISLATGAGAALSSVEIRNGADTAGYGSVAPTGDAPVVTVTGLSSTATQTAYAVKVTAKAHSALAAGSYTFTGTVTAIGHDAAYGVTYSDATSATVTVDNAAPAEAAWGLVSPGDGQVTLNWTNPGGDFTEVVILRNTGPISDAPVEGLTYTAGTPVGTSTVVYAGALQTFTNTLLTNGTDYYFKIFARDACGNYTAGVQTGPHRPAAPAPPVSPAPPTATADSCTQVTVRAPFTGDTYTSNSTTAFARGASAGGPFTPLAGCGAVGGASPRACVDGTTAALTTYYYQVDFTDPDGVLGADPQVVSVTTPRCGYTLTVASAGAVTATTPAPGASGVVVGRLNLAVTAGVGPVVVEAIRLQNTGTAVAGTDVQVLQLFEDNGTLGTLDAADVLLGNATWNGTRYALSGLAYSVPAAPGKNLLAVLAVANGATGGRTFLASVAAADVTAAYPDLVAGSYASATGATITTPAGNTEGDPTANSTKPLVLILNPGNGSTASGTFRVQVKVFDPDGIATVTNLQLSRNNGTDGYAFYVFNLTADKLADTANYDADTVKAAVYEKQLSGAQALTPGTYTLKARASDDNGVSWVQSGGVTITVNAAGRGDGNLLVRDNSSQLCTDCHALRTHSSQTTSRKYGQWGTNCRDCHEPHGTKNVFLVSEQITPPQVTGTYQPTKAVKFSKPAGDSNSAAVADASHVNSDASGPCQVCHTRTTGAGVARWRNTGNVDSHYTAAAGTQACTGCHEHGAGFLAEESKGGKVCANCHGDIWKGMSGQVAKVSKHTLGALSGANDAPTDSGITWGSPLSGNTAASRSCVNMCHQDHVHNQPGGASHSYNAHQDATSAASRQVTRNAAGEITAGTPVTTDFDNAATNGGMCLSCHRNPVNAGGPIIGQAAFNASAHNYTTFSTFGAWQYTQHDGTTFNRNCTKCHANPADTQSDAGTPFGAVHYSDNPKLLSGARNPNGTPATFACYKCHGNGTTGTNLSGKAIATQMAKASGHPSDADAVHDSAAEFTNATFGNALGVAAGAGQRHASCMDCHEPHGARAGTHAVGTNVAGPPLEGAWGAQLSTNPAFWTSPAAGNFTKKTIVAGTDLEATLCFKCHSSFYAATLPNVPSGGYAGTDTAREFNPANVGNYAGAWAANDTAGGFHPVLASAGSNLGAVRLANLVTTNIPWSTTARNLMTCTDCHESDNTADPNGPHGSAAGFILRGPNTTWSAAVTLGSSIPAGTFCLNCHQNTYTNSRFPDHSRNNHYVACWNCHARVPHGGPRPGMLVAGAGGATGVGGTIAGWDTTAPYWGLGTTSADKLYIVSYPANNTTNWSQSNCGCNGTGH